MAVKKKSGLYVDADNKEGYGKILKEVLPEWEVLPRDHGELQYFLESEGATVATELQALPLLESGAANYWYPQIQTAVIIGVDRDKTDTKIEGWNDLRDCRETIGLTGKHPNFGLILCSMSKGFRGDELSAGGAVRFLHKCYLNERLLLDSDEADVLILFDYQAEALRQQGRNIETIVPLEGTLLFTKGVLSKKPIDFPEDLDETLAKAGFLPANMATYAGKESYLRAVPPSDPASLSRFLPATRGLLDRNIVGTHVYATATGGEHAISALVALVVFILWTGSVLYRSLERNISLAVLIMGSCMSLWIILRCIKWQFAIDSTVNRYLWYSFYPFMLILTFAFLWLAVSVNKGGGHPASPVAQVCSWHRNFVIDYDLYQRCSSMGI